MALDRVNARLLEILQKDARTSVSDMARILQRAESTTRERLAVLEKRGFVQRYEAVVDPAKIGYGIQAFLRADFDMADLPELGRRLRGVPNVLSAHLTTGPKPIRIDVVAKDLGALEELVSKHIAPLHLRDIEIRLIVQKLVEPRPPPVYADGEREERLPLADAAIEEPDAGAAPLVARTPPRRDL